MRIPERMKPFAVIAFVVFGFVGALAMLAIVLLTANGI